MTRRGLPSAAQEKVLRAMQEGAVIKRHRSAVDGTEHVRFEPYNDSKRGYTIVSQTFTAMRLAGFIEEQEQRDAAEWWETWTLTPLGLSALRQLDLRHQERRAGEKVA